MLVMVNQSSSIGVFEAFELNGVLLRTPCGKSPVHHRQDSAPCRLTSPKDVPGSGTFNEA